MNLLWNYWFALTHQGQFVFYQCQLKWKRLYLYMAEDQSPLFSKFLLRHWSGKGCCILKLLSLIYLPRLLNIWQLRNSQAHQVKIVFTQVGNSPFLISLWFLPSGFPREVYFLMLRWLALFLWIQILNLLNILPIHIAKVIFFHIKEQF